MTSDPSRHDFATLPPVHDPALDEGYWSALLQDDEYAHSSHPTANGRTHDAMDHEADEASLQPADDELPDADWVEIQWIAEQDHVLDLPVIGYNRGGLLVEWRSLRGFVPASQLLESTTQSYPYPQHAAAHGTTPHYTNGYTSNRARPLGHLVGVKLRLRVIELNPDKNRLIFSERAAQARPGERANLLNRLKTGDIISGVVTNLCDFGAFVDLGGVEGLIHISELSWGRVGHPEHLLKRGQPLQAYVLEVDPQAARVALSLKRLRPDPWKSVEQRYRVGEIIEGTVTNVVDFGAFACVEEGLEGLIHVSELAEGHFLHPRNVVTEGQIVRARILSIDGAARRLGLSLRVSS